MALCEPTGMTARIRVPVQAHKHTRAPARSAHPPDSAGLWLPWKQQAKTRLPSDCSDPGPPCEMLVEIITPLFYGIFCVLTDLGERYI